ncbi:GxxExxY protein [Candidatus Parcubacteria bacterium]|nr:MAG: GxxExxY protein [Candidatus Parcubacteria bacterium]
MYGKEKLLYKDLTYKIRGILFKIHNDLGRFCNEKQYGDAFEQGLTDEGIEYEREKILHISFVGEKKGRNRIDFLIEDKIIIELKCVSCLGRGDYHQCQRYLKSSGLDLALLVNFRPRYLLIRRILNYQKHNKEDGNP